MGTLVFLALISALIWYTYHSKNNNKRRRAMRKVPVYALRNHWEQKELLAVDKKDARLFSRKDRKELSRLLEDTAEEYDAMEEAQTQRALRNLFSAQARVWKVEESESCIYFSDGTIIFAKSERRALTYLKNILQNGPTLLVGGNCRAGRASLEFISDGTPVLLPAETVRVLA